MEYQNLKFNKDCIRLQNLEYISWNEICFIEYVMLI